MKTTYHLNISELKDILKAHFGTTVNDKVEVSFTITDGRDTFDRPTGGSSVTGVSVSFEEKSSA